MTPTSPPPPPDDVDPGTPIRELGDLGPEPDPGFLGRVRSAIDGRLLIGDSVDLHVSALPKILLEYLGALFQALGQKPDPPEPRETPDE